MVNGGGDSRANFLHRQRAPDHAGRTNKDLFGAAIESAGGNLRHPPSIGEAALAGAGVGVSRTNHDGASVVARQALAADLNRSGTDTVLREDARGPRRPVADDECQIEAV